MPPLRSTARYCLLRPWWVTFALSILLDAVSVLLLRRPAVFLNPAIYVWGLATSALVFWWVGFAYRASPAWVQRTLAVLLPCAFLLMAAVNFYIYTEFGEFLTGSMLTFVTDDPRYVHDYLVTYLLKFNTALLLLSFAALIYLWYPKVGGAGDSRPFDSRTSRALGQGRRSAGPVSTALLFFAVPLVCGFSVRSLRPYTRDNLTSVSAATMCALTPFDHPAPVPLHYAPDRLPVSAVSTESDPPNVLVLLNESWGKQRGLAVYGHPVDAMPWFNAWIQRDRQHFLVWNAGYTSSTATDVSLASIVTGVRPDEGADKLHAMPLIWQWGKADGAYTFYLTSVRETFAHFDQFFKCPEMDRTISAETMGSPIVHEAGVDDVVTAQHLRDILDRKPAGQRFLGVMFTNALHTPFQQVSAAVPDIPPFDTRFDKALYILDHAFRTVVDVLREKGLLDNTIIVFGADHGETPERVHATHRLYSYYEEFFNVSYIVYVPERWAAKHAAFYATLQANEARNVSNLDILPTVVDLLGLRDSNSRLMAQLKGQSLVRPIDPNRMLVGLSTNDVRIWEQEGFGLAWGNHRFVFNNVDGSHFFDVSADRTEQHDLWRTIDPADVNVVMSTIRASAHLNRIFNSTGH